MNSLLQQLFMIKSLRSAILAVRIPPECAISLNEDDETHKENKVSRSRSESFFLFFQRLFDEQTDSSNNSNSDKETRAEVSPVQGRNEYNISILGHLQSIFGHLLDSKLQYYIPRGFWKAFK